MNLERILDLALTYGPGFVDFVRRLIDLHGSDAVLTDEEIDAAVALIPPPAQPVPEEIDIPVDENDDDGSE